MATFTLPDMEVSAWALFNNMRQSPTLRSFRVAIVGEVAYAHYGAGGRALEQKLDILVDRTPQTIPGVPGSLVKVLKRLLAEEFPGLFMAEDDTWEYDLRMMVNATTMLPVKFVQPGLAGYLEHTSLTPVANIANNNLPYIRADDLLVQNVFRLSLLPLEEQRRQAAENVAMLRQRARAVQRRYDPHRPLRLTPAQREAVLNGLDRVFFTYSPVSPNEWRLLFGLFQIAE
ncbi:uncharacterized protein BJX67DRAFT_379567 [Aspergillus lucknowensis]|uniref:Uncharacterized protein n=1 Tax=Aspergillus lucknowensis TaxID=176173 RepID=A0ABR4LX32_9EURO